MTSNIDDLIVNKYDQYVFASGGSVISADAKSAIELEIALALEAEERDYLTEARLRINHTISGSRDKRRNHIKKALKSILEALPEGDGYDDPALDLAFPLGTTDGQDKALRYWTTDDFDNLVSTAYRTSADAVAAAKELDELVQKVKRRITSTGSAALGDAVIGRAVA